jgi:hypothetical protein
VEINQIIGKKCDVSKSDEVNNLVKGILDNFAIICQYLHPEGGMSLREIGDSVGISKTSVYNIINGSLNKKDPIFPLMPTLIESLHKNGIDLREYADIIRISNVLKQYDIEPSCGREDDKINSLYMLSGKKTIKMITNSALHFGKRIREHAQLARKNQDRGKALSELIYSHLLITAALQKSYKRDLLYLMSKILEDKYVPLTRFSKMVSKSSLCQDFLLCLSRIMTEFLQMS